MAKHKATEQEADRDHAADENQGSHGMYSQSGGTDPADAEGPGTKATPDRGRPQDERLATRSQMPPEDTGRQYEQAIEKIAAGVEKLCKAGMGGKDAGEIAAQVYYQCSRGRGGY